MRRDATPSRHPCRAGVDHAAPEIGFIIKHNLSFSRGTTSVANCSDMQRYLDDAQKRKGKKIEESRRTGSKLVQHIAVQAAALIHISMRDRDGRCPGPCMKRRPTQLRDSRKAHSRSYYILKRAPLQFIPPSTWKGVQCRPLRTST